jgi:sugar lactone lactonase YvrE
MLRKAAAVVAVVLVAAIAYLTLAPVPIEPVVWQAPAAPGYTGPHAQNTRLARLQHFAIGNEEGPESIALGPDGKLYAAVASGAIVRVNADGSGFEKWAATGGRVLGIEFDAQGRLIAADVMRGVVAIDRVGKVELLTDAAGDPIRYANSVAVAKSGRIYFTDSSRRFGPKEWGGTFNASVHDIFEHSATGRVLEYDPATGRTRTVMGDLCFANGVALSSDESRVLVVETCEYRIWSVDPAANNLSAKTAAAAASAQARILLSNLPGYPDNLTRGRDGRIWLGLVKPRGAAVDKLSARPFVRKVVMRLPKSWWPVPPNYGHVIAFNDAGTIVADLQDPRGAYPETTGVTETADRLYIQSLNAKSIGWLSKADAGLK